MVYLIRCHNKFLELQRSHTETIDYQVIKLQEIAAVSATESPVNSNVEPSRIPRTFEVELRGSELVSFCIPGDIVRVVGVVKTYQVR